MISRKTAVVIGKVYEFRYMYVAAASGGRRREHRTRRDELYDFLYENDYPASICNKARDTRYGVGYGERAVREWVMKFHTGESLVTATINWTWEQRSKKGQQYLQDLAQDILNDWKGYTPSAWNNEHVAYERLHGELLGSLELDGYSYNDSRLLAPESDVLDVEEETGVLHSLYAQLALPHKDQNPEFLRLSEEHYLASRWADSIANSRKFLEGTLQEIAAVHSSQVNGSELGQGTYKSAMKVRNYLEREGLLDTKETDALAKVYGLLSERGSHPNMAYNDHARLLRHLALTFSQFAMLRLQGSLK